jgi:hypothetical protein
MQYTIALALLTTTTDCIVLFIRNGMSHTPCIDKLPLLLKLLPGIRNPPCALHLIGV